MKNVEYSVIILNYNTVEDCKIAIRSIHNAATTKNYCICIVDGGSTKDDEIKKIKMLEDERVRICLMDNNLGYARGNNEGIRFLEKEYVSKYTVIMNPDVEIIQKGTIEGLINTVESYDEKIIGAQPLINCNDIDLAPNMQVCIRKKMKYSDILVNSSWILKRIFHKKVDGLVYKKERPYCEELEFDVPSGAFFLVRTEDFKRVGYFDEKTFLYCEEIILGFKVNQLNKRFILNPNYSVEHYQGKATGSHNKIMSDFSMRCTIESHCIYLRDYLRVGKLKITIYVLSAIIGHYTKKFILKILKVAI